MALRGPLGTRDLLPESAERRFALQKKLVKVLEQAGARPIVTPPIETLATLDLGMAAIDRRELLRFVDIDTGDSLALRPDITPQIARALAQQKNEHTLPMRVWYAGDVMRRARGRARLNRQIYQLGCEWIGEKSGDADVLMLELVHRALLSVGLKKYLIELRLPSFGRTLLSSVADESLRAQLAQAIANKDTYQIRALAVPERVQEWALELARSFGPLATWNADAFSFINKRDRAALNTLSEVQSALQKRKLSQAGNFAFDLGEFRDHGYYTGLAFTVYADGPGEPLGSGGRYDELFARFGWPIPALGFAFDLGHVERALSARTRD